MSEDWFIWVIKQTRFEDVERFLKTLPEIHEVLYPTTIKEYKLSKGSIKKKRVPLYSGYLFLRYDNPVETFNKLRAHPFITTYAGKCTGSDLEKVREVRQLEEWNAANKKFEIDDRVRINCGPFKDFEGYIVAINSSNVVAYITVFGREVKVKISNGDADILKRGCGG